MLAKITAMLSLCLLLSCATSTSIVRVKDQSIGKPLHNRLVVSAPYDNLQVRSNIESRFAKFLSTGYENVTCLRAMDILPPLKEYTEIELESTFAAHDVKLLLVVAVTDFWENYRQVLPSKTITNSESTTESTSRSETRIESWGMLTSVNTRGSSSAKTRGKSSTYTIPGLSLSQSNVSLDARLFQVNLRSMPTMVWRANSTTSGNYYTSGSRVLDAAAGEINAALIKDSILQAPAPKKSLSDQESRIRQVVSPLDNSQILGCLSCPEWDFESIRNPHGRFGKTYDQSIWNREGLYGSDTSDCSACNPRASNPPIIVDFFGKEVGRLSVNPDISSGPKTKELRKWLMERVCAQPTLPSHEK